MSAVLIGGAGLLSTVLIGCAGLVLSILIGCAGLVSAVVIGVLLGVVIGSVPLGIAYFCLRR